MMPPDQLNPAEGVEVLAAFRSSGLVSDVSFMFDLRHTPRRGPTSIFGGQLWTAQSVDGLMHRIWLRSDMEPGSQREWLLLSGRNPQAFAPGDTEGTVVTLDASALMEPLAPGIAVTPFDLQMAFVFWEDHVYEGTRRVRGRPAHFFLLYPPESAGDLARYVGGVRIIVDAGFNALLGVEVLDPDARLVRSWSIQNFRKVEELWIVRVIDMTDHNTRDRTRFEIRAAAVWLNLPRAIFDPASFGEHPAEPVANRFVWF
ncbi:MAG: outer membrane lipoprotein-sorting protein [Verrucomicrobia bacterium]|nr:outer membrane lipoprotein-sorting protein [Verrucomicrobiota bacterium]